MTTEIISMGQAAAIIGFISAVFGLYRILVQKKDAVIQLLKERLAQKDEQIAALQAQTPDTFVSILNDRIKVTQDEICRLKADEDTHRSEIKLKVEELQGIQGKLSVLSDLIRESDLICPHCGDPLAGRHVHTIYGGRDGEQEADILISNYECGYSIADDGKELSRCQHHVPT
ncbi:hypothetical protein ACE1YR_14275 [Pseudomonas sp. K1(2024)]|uniref:Uncharacterized protein n=1 Tax=Pseudomonas boreofloridensis TaxID=3064348 RepID=A0ABV4ZAR8_9PSED|nr:hypothetical protein [Pseudomonas sp. K13]MDO7903391.1 hypothetical protein [Pseudomonas sp. K13]